MSKQKVMQFLRSLLVAAGRGARVHATHHLSTPRKQRSMSKTRAPICTNDEEMTDKYIASQPLPQLQLLEQKANRSRCKKWKISAAAHCAFSVMSS